MLLQIIALTLTAPAPAPAQTLTDARVQCAIEAVRAAIIDRHRTKRHWDPVRMPSGESARQLDGGYTALACLALVQSGHPWHVEPLRGAIETLASSESTGTYAVALRVLLFASLPDRFRPPLERDVALLASGFDHARGGWTYSCETAGGRGPLSPSVRHMALLALRAASWEGIAVPDSMTSATARVLLQEQAADGGWSYRAAEPSTGSMTAAAIASLLLALDVAGESAEAGEAVHRGMRWLDAHFQPHPPPGGGRSRGFPMYWLYALERTAMETGRRTLCGTDWFAASAQEVIDRLLDDEGGVKARRTSTASLRQLCFGLLVLHRGRVPLCASVLVVDAAAAPPPLARHFARTVSRQTESGHAWQAVTIDDPPRVWLEAPMLLAPPGIELIDPVALKVAMERHVQQGGMVVFAGRGGAFVKAARASLADLTPRTRWRRLPAGRMPRGIIAPARPKPIRAEVLEHEGRLVAWLLLDRPSRKGGWSEAMFDALLDAWGTATERTPFPPRLTLGAELAPLDAPVAIDWLDGEGNDTISALFAPQSQCDAVVIAGRGDCDRAVRRAKAHAQTGRAVLITSIGGDIDFAQGVIAAAGLGPRRPWWPTAAPAPRWRPFSRQTRPDRALDLPLLLAAPDPDADAGGILLCPCDVLAALLNRPAWGVHGLESPSARSLLAGLHELYEDVDHDPALPSHSTMAPADGDRSDPAGRADHAAGAAGVRSGDGPAGHLRR